MVTFGPLASEKTTGKTTGKTPEKTPEAILRLLTDRPAISVAELAARLGKSESAINRAMRQLRESGRLKRIGPDKGGHWQVIHFRPRRPCILTSETDSICNAQMRVL